MKNIRLTYLLLLTGLALLWLIAETSLPGSHGFRALQLSVINLTGILAIGCMSSGIVIAVRPTSMERFLGGLDKMYRLHKWLGISALVLSTLHWLCAKSPSWLIGLGWMQGPLRERGLSPSVAPSAFVQILDAQHGLAKGIGEWTFYATVAIIVVALLKAFPYRHFFKTHRLLAVAYPLLAFHAVVLMKHGYWTTAIGPVITLLIILAMMATSVSLLRRIGRTRQAAGHIEELVHYREMRVLSIVIKLKDRWLGHAAGQFAFVTFDAHEGAHPFTISSAWHDDGKVRFHIKSIGDYTVQLPAVLKTGARVSVEGPYGRFDFRSDKPRQIWIAGGIGITPFLARMRARERHSDKRAVDLFYSTNAMDDEFVREVSQLAMAANVRLHVLISGKDDRLTGQRVREIVPDWMSSDVWFCGPASFGQNLRHDLVARGLAHEDFHQELFDMR
ncbi:ferric reductase-like transmembrane domain-containing protein [Paraburkholderia sp. BL25I1N1]|uniref:ferredoxin reductase family protein n=1 Tax=Paraburkholderia sp. BL25I1N1 TaxID=1938804 RepID=UPI000D066B6D|nr:ferric reductase-like transmembrane domain-containing protein [Paraburkholderia sp. BL25I1N1]PRX91787.1 putative ferric reductase [Paraburkholderia sp. BL25I1N1]